MNLNFTSSKIVIVEPKAFYYNKIVVNTTLVIADTINSSEKWHKS